MYLSYAQNVFPEFHATKHARQLLVTIPLVGVQLQIYSGVLHLIRTNQVRVFFQQFFSTNP